MKEVVKFVIINFSKVILLLLHKIKLDNYIEEEITNKGKKFYFLTDGSWDIQYLLLKESIKKKVELKAHYRRFIDLQKIFQKAYPEVEFHPKPSLKRMSKHLRLEMKNHHSGIADCQSICNIVLKMLEDGKSVDEYTFLPEGFNPITDPTVSDYNVYISREELNEEKICQVFHFLTSQVFDIYEAIHIDGGAEIAFVLVVHEDYNANVNFKRGNLTAKVYNKHKFVREIQNDIFLYALLFLPLGCIWRQHSGVSDFRLDNPVVKSITVASIYKFYSLLKKFMRMRVWHACISTWRSIWICLRIGRQLIEHAEIKDWKSIVEEVPQIDFKSEDIKNWKNSHDLTIQKKIQKLENLLRSSCAHILDLEQKLIKENPNMILLPKLIEKIGEEKLCRKLGIQVQKHPIESLLFHFSSSRETLKDSLTVFQCRGLILNRVNNKYEFVCSSVPKYKKFTLEEIVSGEKKIEFDNTGKVEVKEKLGGFTVILFHFNQEWKICSLVTPDASESIIKSGYKPLHEAFWSCWKEKKMCFPKSKNISYIFKFLSSEQDVKINLYHIQNQIILIGCRDNTTGEEINPSNKYFSFLTFN